MLCLRPTGIQKLSGSGKCWTSAHPTFAQCYSAIVQDGRTKTRNGIVSYTKTDQIHGKLHSFVPDMTNIDQLKPSQLGGVAPSNWPNLSSPAGTPFWKAVPMWQHGATPMVLLLPGESQTLIAPVSKPRKEVSHVSKCSTVELMQIWICDDMGWYEDMDEKYQLGYRGWVPPKKIWKFPSQCPVFPYFWVDGHPRKRSTDAVILKTNVATLEVTYVWVTEAPAERLCSYLCLVVP